MRAPVEGKYAAVISNILSLSFLGVFFLKWKVLKAMVQDVLTDFNDLWMFLKLQAGKLLLSQLIGMNREMIIH